MPATTVLNVIVPEVFTPYVIQKTVELSKLYRSGIIKPDPKLDELAAKGGRLINMPFWNDLTGEDEVLADGRSLTVNGITSGKDVAALLMRGKAWGASDLSKALSGDDPMAAIGDLVAEYWARRLQAVLLATLKGAFLGTGMSGKVLDISALVGDLACFTGATFVDATQTMGDAKENLSAVMMHSATESSLRKQGLLEDEIQNLNGTNIKITRFQGKEVIVDDACPQAAGTYTSYIFGAGAIGYGEGAAPTPTETDRDTLAGEDILINRKHFIFHPRGVKFLDASVAEDSPTNAELETAANWGMVYEAKNIRIVAFKHKLK